MSNRLENLERERDRLEQALAENPDWCAFLEAQRRRTAGLPGGVLSDETATALARNDLVVAYLKVMEEIAAEAARGPEKVREPESIPGKTDAPTETAASSAGREESANIGVVANKGAFRTRVTVKSATAAKSASNDSKAEDNKADVGGNHAHEVSHREKASAPAVRPDKVDDLTRIRQINRALASRLNELDVWTFETIANWDRFEVRRVRDALGLDRQIWRENWIEQAALLQLGSSRNEREARSQPTVVPPPLPLESGLSPGVARRHAVGHSRAIPIARELADACSEAAAEQDLVRDQPPAASRVESVELVAEQLPASAPPPLSVSPPTEPTEDVAAAPVHSEVLAPKRKTFRVGRRPGRLPAPAARRFAYLRGVSDEMAEAIRGAGVTSLSDIARWSRSDVRWFQAILGDDARIGPDQWIEQATLLSNGSWTKYALRVVSGDTRTLVSLPEKLVASTIVAKVNADVALTAEQARPREELQIEIAASNEEALRSSEIASPRGGPFEPDPAGPSNPMAQTGAKEMRAPADAKSMLAPKIELGGLRRPPPDLGMRWHQPVHLDAQPRADLLVTPPSTEIIRPRSPTTQPASEPAIPARVPPEPIPDRGPAPPKSKPLARTGSLAEALVGSKVRGDKQDSPVSPPSVASPEEVSVLVREPEPISDAEDQGPEPVELSEEALSELVASDDWDDAEALVIRRAEPEPEDKTPDPSFEAIEVIDAPAPPAAPAVAEDPLPVLQPHELAVEPVLPAASEVGEGSEGGFVWGDEAEVVIVAKPRSEPVATEPPPGPPPAPPPARERFGYSPEFIAQRMQNARVPDDGFDAGHAGYRDFVEEASVTIIRAESSAANAASIVPTEIANDAEAPEDDTAEPKFRKIGSKFLKALTGD